MESKLFSVSELNNLIKDLFLEFPLFQKISLKGEITNYKGANRSGHFYFSLKDENSIIGCVLFKYDSFNVDIELKIGMEVIVEGQLSVYAPSGSYHIIVKEIKQENEIGSLLLKREKLKEKLIKAGYFEESHKLKLPEIPNKIAIITGKNSAASVDFKHNLERRWPIIEIEFYNCLVQGEKAPADIVDNIKLAENSDCDVIILGRGGGASDDLNAFDDENVVKAIYDCKKPIIAAIGHEINKTFSDFVADFYASTPTAAAELAVPEKNEFIRNLEAVKDNLNNKVELEITKKLRHLSNVKANPIFTNINTLFEIKLNKLKESRNNLDVMLQKRIEKYSSKLESYQLMIENFNPLKLLEKGYSIIKDENGNIINDAKAINKNDLLTLTLSKGTVKARVEDKKDE